MATTFVILLYSNILDFRQYCLMFKQKTINQLAMPLGIFGEEFPVVPIVKHFF